MNNRGAADVALLSLQGLVAKEFSAAGFLRIGSYGQISTLELLPSPTSTTLPIIHVQPSDLFFAAELSSLNIPCELSSILRGWDFRFLPSQLFFPSTSIKGRFVTEIGRLSSPSKATGRDHESMGLSIFPGLPNKDFCLVYQEGWCPADVFPRPCL